MIIYTKVKELAEKDTLYKAKITGKRFEKREKDFLNCKYTLILFKKSQIINIFFVTNLIMFRFIGIEVLEIFFINHTYYIFTPGHNFRQTHKKNKGIILRSILLLGK